MFCDKCGKPVEDTAAFCSECGNVINAPKPAPDAQKPSNNSLIAKIILLVSLVCFVMPFVTVSCGNTEISCSGVELATGLYSNDMIQEEDVPLNIFVTVSLVASVAVAVLVFGKKGKNIVVQILSGISAFSLILFMCTFKSYYKLQEFGVEFKFGVWAVIILNIVLAVIIKGLPEPESNIPAAVQSTNEENI